MATVYNWQIGREMEYPFRPRTPDRQWAAVFDLNKCIACQTCTLACKTTWTSGEGQEHMFWNNVETKPYGSHPIGWDVEILDQLGFQEWGSDGVYDGDTIFEAKGVDWDEVSVNEVGAEPIEGYIPEDEDWAYPNLGEDEPAGERVEADTYIDEETHPMWFFYLPRICNHCSFAGCVGSCPVGAITKRDDGIVLINEDACRSQLQCVKACPYMKSIYNPAEGNSQKCIGCYPKVEEGLVPQCFENCLGKIRLHGWINDPEQADPSNPMDYLVHELGVAKPLYPQLGLQPHVYYIPPINVPDDYLFQMFGPGVADAKDIYQIAREGGTEYRKLRGLLHLIGSTEYIIEEFEVNEQEAIGYDANGRMVARVPMTEPQAKRPHFDEANDVYRLDVT